jgi:hypothetical protein
MSDNDRKSGQLTNQLTTRQQIEMRTSDVESGGFDDWLRQAVTALAARRQFGLPRCFQRGGTLVRVRPAAVGAPATS